MQKLSVAEARYERGGEGHGHFKMYLNELVGEYFKDAREQFAYFMTHREILDEILSEGAAKAHKYASATMQKVREAVGIYR